MPDKTSLPRFSEAARKIRQKAQAQSTTVAGRRREQLIALLYRNGGGLLMTEILEHPDAPPLVEAVIDQNPDYFCVGLRLVRLSWVTANAVYVARAKARLGQSEAA
jgi:hypothetical protein